MQTYYVLFRTEPNGVNVPLAYSEKLNQVESYSIAFPVIDIRRIGPYTLIALKSAHFIIDLDK